MMLDDLRNSAFSRTLSEFLGDLTDLIQKEIRLVRAEVSDKIGARLQAVIWMAAAGVIALVAVLFFLAGIVFALIAWGLTPQLSCFLVAAAVAILAVILFSYGRALLAEDLLPSRAVRQLNENIKTIKEQLT
jgi:VIT1/CCC1 family predicted Fe2+/Mn2+ transporter